MVEGLPAIPVTSNSEATPEMELAKQYNVSKSLFGALFNTKDRQFVLKLESSLLDFIESNVNSYKLSPMNSYFRLLTHQIAEYHGLRHILSNDGASVVVFKTFTPPNQLNITGDEDKLIAGEDAAQEANKSEGSEDESKKKEVSNKEDGTEKIEKSAPKPRLADIPIPNGVLSKKIHPGYKNQNNYTYQRNANGTYRNNQQIYVNGYNRYYNEKAMDASPEDQADEQNSDTINSQVNSSSSSINLQNVKIMKRNGQEKYIANDKNGESKEMSDLNSSVEELSLNSDKTADSKITELQHERASKEELYKKAKERIYSEQNDEGDQAEDGEEDGEGDEEEEGDNSDQKQNTFKPEYKKQYQPRHYNSRNYYHNNHYQKYNQGYNGYIDNKNNFNNYMPQRPMMNAPMYPQMSPPSQHSPYLPNQQLPMNAYYASMATQGHLPPPHPSHPQFMGQPMKYQYSQPPPQMYSPIPPNMAYYGGGPVMMNNNQGRRFNKNSRNYNNNNGSGNGFNNSDKVDDGNKK
ncbi:Rbs1 protein [Saccharomycopsis crataegensis]|uniref:Rbs1 protein n=1 Tax=Saccharomycopsis crataegensis TaxID=43959 RepID=A0AAV5QF29_9ASCO|nr:Rbs1 protein [Saccharomycopsis crataegensis]